MPHLRVALVPAPDLVVVRVVGDADVSTVGRLTSALEEAAGLGTGRVVVDVAGTRFRDCSALYALTRFTDALSPAGRSCRVVGAPAATRRLVRAAGLADRLELDGPLAGEDPVRPAANRLLPLFPAEPVPPARRSGVLHQVRGTRRADDRPARHTGRLGTLRRWR
ncbi:MULTISPECIES: STAS domain-containing protein [unclassified Geodermatophilus]|uniref:STAS domain-containing protein n=1 Tax=unclassified Geodermatophilus TaxID=2637632 RepID=UPI003EF024B0